MSFTFHQQLVLRTPEKPIKTVFEEDELIAFFSQEQHSHYLLSSSPNLWDELNRFLEGKFVDSIRKKKLIHSLNKYALRLHNRPTPFGNFSGCAVVHFSDQTDITFKKNKTIRNNRLDIQLIQNMIQKLLQFEEITQQLTFFPNSTYHFDSHKVKYFEPTVDSSKNTEFRVCSIEVSWYLYQVLTKKRSKGWKYDEITALLINDGIEPKEAKSYVHELITSKIIFSELETILVHELSPQEQLIRKLDQLTGNLPEEVIRLKDILKDLDSKLNRSINKDIRIDLTFFNEIIEQLDLMGIPYDRQKLIQTDLTYELSKSSLDEKIRPKLAKAIHTIEYYSENNNSMLSSFKKKFTENYGEKLVPILEVFDTERGIGFGSHSKNLDPNEKLVNQIASSKETGQVFRKSERKERTELKNKLLETINNRESVLHLSSKEIPSKKSALPLTFSVLFSSIQNKDNEEQLFIRLVGGASATNLISRFSPHSSSIQKLSKDISSFESAYHKDKLVASINHAPEAIRVGNVLIHQPIRKYEIPFLSNTNIGSKSQLNLQDILVTVRQDRIVLFSKKYKKEIIPFLDNAHNFVVNTLPIYQFLCCLQSQEYTPGLDLNISELLENHRFYPRIQVDDIIISPATWQLNKNEFPDIADSKNEEQTKSTVLKWIKKVNLPDLFIIADFDNEMVINSTNEISLNMFIDELNKRHSITLKEHPFENGETIVKDQNGAYYNNEFLATVFHNQSYREKAETVQLPVSEIKHKKLKRDFPPGSEWIFYKIYCSEDETDFILTHHISPLVESLKEKELIISWFFIRYYDTDNHLRLRFQLGNKKNVQKVFKAVNDQLNPLFTSSGMVKNIQLDTYKREVERYGLETIELAEYLFQFDSEFISELNAASDCLESIEDYWMVSLLSIDTLLNDFYLDLSQKREVMDLMSKAYFHEFSMGTGLKKEIDKKYRQYRNHFFDVLQQKHTKFKQVNEMAAKRSAKNRKTIDLILDIQQKFPHAISRFELLSSLIHMNLNRLLKSDLRANELLVYFCIFKTYESLSAISASKS